MTERGGRDNYGESGGIQFRIYKVINRKDDPEQCGRCIVQEVTGFENQIPPDQCTWARPCGDATDPQMGGIGKSLVGAMEGTHLVGFQTDQAQGVSFTHSLPKAGEDGGQGGQLAQENHKHSFPKPSRDREKQGGDDHLYQGEYLGVSPIHFAYMMSPDAYGNMEGKEVPKSGNNDVDTELGSIGQVERG